MLEWVVTPQESGLKLISYLSNRLESQYSLRFLKRLVEQNCCEINGKTERFASTILSKGDHICLHIEQVPSPSKHRMEKTRILYEDDALLVYNKPAGINSDEKGLLRLLSAYSPTLQLVHRLDRDTTGVIILAKQNEVFETLVRQFKEFKIYKSYKTIVDGRVSQPRGVIKNFLGKKKQYAGQAFWGSVKSSSGFFAHTEWQRIKTGKKATLLACEPKTGRTHQIRVHMAEMGHPVLGDFQYCKQFQCPYRPVRYLLHAEEIHFQHPLTGIPLTIKAPLPDDFKIAIQKLFRD